MPASNLSQTSVLVIGAASRTGLECIKQLSLHQTRLKVHAFLETRDSDKLSAVLQSNCQTIIEGCDYRVIEGALKQLKVTDVIVVIEHCNETTKAKSQVRAAITRALVSVLCKNQFRHVRVILLSRSGAGGSKINLGLGIGSFLSHRRRYLLLACTMQEAAMLPLRKRSTVLRPTALNDDPSDENYDGGNLHVFADYARPPTNKTHRSDVAAWVASEICEKRTALGRTLNVTSVPRERATNFLK